MISSMATYETLNELNLRKKNLQEEETNYNN